MFKFDKVRKKVTHDRMWIKFISADGHWVRLSITRGAIIFRFNSEDLKNVKTEIWNSFKEMYEVEKLNYGEIFRKLEEQYS